MAGLFTIKTPQKKRVAGPINALHALNALQIFEQGAGAGNNYAAVAANHPKRKFIISDEDGNVTHVALSDDVNATAAPTPATKRATKPRAARKGKRRRR